MGRDRLVRLQIMLDDAELAAIENWRFQLRMPSRAAAVRELLRRGLDAEGFKVANMKNSSDSYGVVSAPPEESNDGP